MQQEESLKLLDDTLDAFPQPEQETQNKPPAEPVKQANVSKISRIRTATGAGMFSLNFWECVLCL